MLHPVGEPLNAFQRGAFIAEHVTGHRQTDQLMPAAQFPNQLDVSPAGQFTMVQFKSAFLGREVFADEMILVLLRRVLHLNFKTTKGLPAPGEDFFCVPRQRFPQGRRRVFRARQFRKING